MLAGKGTRRGEDPRLLYSFLEVLWIQAGSYKLLQNAAGGEREGNIKSGLVGRGGGQLAWLGGFLEGALSASTAQIYPDGERLCNKQNLQKLVGKDENEVTLS